MVAYVVDALDDVTVAEGLPVAGMDLMSPFVWHGHGHYRILLRAVPRPMTETSPTGIICAGTSADGLLFHMDDAPAIAPGPDAIDAAGCEDPTVVLGDNGRYLVFYTGVGGTPRQGSLLVAEGSDLMHMTKRNVALQAPPGEGNIKEATLARTASGEWRLFYEYAAENASRVGLASGPTADGPWAVLPDPFGIRADSWDNWHLSTGPIIAVDGGDPVMFYNGATNDARWRIGWISFDRDYARVTGRGLEPLIVPPPAEHRDATDIAFAASTVLEGDRLALYYSLEDRILRRAMLRRYG